MCLRTKSMRRIRWTLGLSLELLASITCTRSESSLLNCGGRGGTWNGGREEGKGREEEGGKEGRKGEFQAYTDCNDICNTLNYLPLEDLVHECVDVASCEGLPQCSHLKHTAPQGPDV